MKSKKVWVVLANGASGKIYNFNSKDQDLISIKEFSSIDARLHIAQAGAANLRRSQESAAGIRNSIEPKIDLHQKEKLNFIHLIADFINNQANEKAFDELIICAAPETLGILRKLIDKNTYALTKKEINKDLTHHNKNDIIEHLRA